MCAHGNMTYVHSGSVLFQKQRVLCAEHTQTKSAPNPLPNTLHGKRALYHDAFCDNCCRWICAQLGLVSANYVPHSIPVSCLITTPVTHIVRICKPCVTHNTDINRKYAIKTWGYYQTNEREGPSTLRELINLCIIHNIVNIVVSIISKCTLKICSGCDS